tara:strand:+ start:718 stop:900 length:183 start_codon:yes stop_codon:yes gene_type:complete
MKKWLLLCGTLDSKESLFSERPQMIAHLNEIKKFMKDLSPELAVSDPVSEDIVDYIAEFI